MAVKFFPHDIISGKAEKVGDKFTAMFFGAVEEFIVESIHGDVIMTSVEF